MNEFENTYQNTKRDIHAQARTGSLIEPRFLGLAFYSNGMYMSRYVPYVRPQWFSSAEYADIWKHMMAMYREHKQIEFYAVMERCYPFFKRHDDPQELMKLFENAAVITAWSETMIQNDPHNDLYFKELRQAYKQRRMWEINDQQKQALEKTDDPDEVEAERMRAMRELSDEIQDLEIMTPQQAADSSFEEYIREANEQESGARKHTAFGIDSFDSATGGIRAGQVYVLGARTGSGKSIVAMNIAKNVCQQGKKVLYVSLEMKKKDILQRLWASVGRIHMHDIITRRNSTEFMQRLDSANEQVKQLDLTIIDKGPFTPAHIEQELARQQYDLVVVDHLGLMRQDAKRSRYEVQSQHINDINALCMEYDTCALVLVQLSKEGYVTNGKEDPAPRMAHIKDSSAIAEAAEAVFILHRAKTDDLAMAGKRLDVYVEKARNTLGEPKFTLTTNLDKMFISSEAEPF